MPSYILSVPTARILGKPEMFVDVGSTINITCVVENAPGNVRWMHKEKVHKVTKWVCRGLVNRSLITLGCLNTLVGL